ncbi:molybdopterin-dependent oxidoreductase [Roseospira navarrensis]|uniref:Molybdopterin-dependent oxidoreductase n=2 Tax=Roseospira navarrensis TaxID=140058 RepID=A0A7X2D576_9PROT|nr:molybdopterin-dependent oxidoreductase [Roseospira navarrensis]
MMGTGAGLTLGLVLPGSEPAAAADGDNTTDAGSADLAPNAFVRLARDGRVTVICKHLEMGQGVYTGLCALVAEELDAPWDSVHPAPAPADAALYNNLYWGPLQGTGASTSLANAFEQMRRAGAVARAMLVRAAAEAWDVPPDEIETTDGRLRHAAGDRSAGYGEMAAAAAALPVPDPDTVPLKDPATFRLIGRVDLHRPDAAAKIDGSALYASDIRLPGMLVARIRRPPRFGATVKSVNTEAALAVPGVKAVTPLPAGAGLAVVAEMPWQTARALAVLAVEWDDSATVTTGTDAILERYREQAKTPGTVVRNQGDAAAALTKPDSVAIEATYDVPYQAHAPMETPSAVAHLTDSGIEIWTASQTPTTDVLAVAEAARVDPARVTLHPTFAGGSFGLRARPDGGCARDVAAIARALAEQGIGAPVQLVWTREDEIRGGWYRPMALHTVSGAVDANGRPTAWRHRVVCQSILKGTVFEGPLMGDGIDPTCVEGVADLPYAVPNMYLDLHMPETGVPVLWWRAGGHSHTAFATESFVDELAHAAGTDPLALRLDLLRDAHPDMLNVLLLVADKAGWAAPLAPGRGRGLAVHRSRGTSVAQVAEVTVKDSTIVVDRVVCAVHCGLPVNPSVIRAQVEGAIVFGLSAALRGRITMDDTGAVEQSNFHNFEVLRMAAVPDIEVHILPSTAAPTGIGEPALPPVAPAVANAVFAATGTRLRSLPLRLKG